MAKPTTLTPRPPDTGQDYIEMDRIPPRRGNPKEAQRTIAILVGSIAVLGAGVGLRATVFKPRFDTPTLQEMSPPIAGNKEVVTDIPTGFTQGPVPIRARTTTTRGGKRTGEPVPSPFERPGATAVPGTTADTNTPATTAATETTDRSTYDPFSVVRSAASQPTVSLTPRNANTDAGAPDTTSTYTPYAAPGTSPAGGSYSPTTTTPPVGGGAYGSGSGAYGSSGGAYGTGRGSTTGGGFGSTGGNGSYGAGSYGAGSGTTTGTSGTGIGGVYGSPR